MMRKQQKRNRLLTGAAATELALVLPLMFTLAFAGMDFGRMLHVYIALSNACRAGAEYGSLNPYSPLNPDGWETRIQEVVAEELSATPSIDPSQLETNVDIALDADGLYTVSVETRLSASTFVTWPGLPHTVTMHQRASMRQLR